MTQHIYGKWTGKDGTEWWLDVDGVQRSSVSMRPIHEIAYLDTLAHLAGLWSGTLYLWNIWAPARHEVEAAPNSL